MCSGLKRLCILCFVLWILENMELNGGAYMAGYVMADTVKAVGYQALSILTETASSALTAGEIIVAGLLV